jgi:hypothetical protein
MKGQIEDEIKGATYVVDLAEENDIFPADRKIVEAFGALTSGGDSSATDPRLPAISLSGEPQ